jgi:hypothetical protein
MSGTAIATLEASSSAGEIDPGGGNWKSPQAKSKKQFF